MKQQFLNSFMTLFAVALLASCKKDNTVDPVQPTSNTITIENVLDSKPLVESGTFMGT